MMEYWSDGMLKHFQMILNPLFQHPGIDGLVKSRKMLFSVIPAEAGIQCF
jgi:hypothetical protein